jgi:hypothetical protein
MGVVTNGYLSNGSHRLVVEGEKVLHDNKQSICNCSFLFGMLNKCIT